MTRALPLPLLALGCAPAPSPAVQRGLTPATVLDAAVLSCAEDGALQVEVRSAGWKEWAYVDVWRGDVHERVKATSYAFVREDQSCDLSRATFEDLACEADGGGWRVPDDVLVLVRLTYEKLQCAGCATLGDPLEIDARLPGRQDEDYWLLYQLDCPDGSLVGDDPLTPIDDLERWRPASTAACDVLVEVGAPAPTCP